MAKDFLDVLRRSRLVEEEPLQRFLDDFATREGKSALENGEKIAQGLVERGLLTSWQADNLLAGKHRGFMLGKYKLLEHLGKGGMSQVFLAEHTLMKRKVAIKVLPKSRVEDATYLERFRIEARAAAKLDHPNIVRTYDIDQDGDTHYIVMEYVQGQNLHELVRDKGPLPFETAADHIAQVARGLHHAHEMGLIHRDIKPANCLVDRNLVVKLLDMGLARLIDDEASLTLDHNENVLGTADYLAPEQALNSHKADARADIYSLGCTMYFLLTGHPPYPEGTISERLLKHQVEKPSPITNDRPDAPPSLVAICNRMMSKKVEDRFQTAAEVAQKLTDWLAERGREVGDSGKANQGANGPGSDPLGRYAAAFQRGPSKGPSPSGKKLAPVPRGNAAPTIEEEMVLAPLEDESPKQASQSSGVLDPKLTSPSARSTGSDPHSSAPRRSLIEEELEKVAAPSLRRPINAAGQSFDPLHPPGYSGPQYGTPVWVYVLVGTVMFFLMAGALALVLNS